ncbi:MAG: cytochrome c, partial [Dokdonella sp.]
MAAALAVVAIALFVYSGIYNIGADDPHMRPVSATLEALRERSIETHSRNIVVPNLDDPKMIAEGAEHYSAMCTGCHLAPGMSNSEIRPGLYPQPPNLSTERIDDPRETFWIIKHGIKMSAMPAWGTTHDDEAIWNMVAFVRKLPDMTPAQYAQMTANAAHDDGGYEHGHEHGADAVGTGDDDHSSSAANDRPGEAATDHVDGADHDHAANAASPLSLDGLTPGAAPEAEAIAAAFHNALKNGDRDAVLVLLSPDVAISEDGHTQTRDEYAAGHLAADIAFLKDAKIEVLSQGSMLSGDSASVGSES